ncbi:MAG: cytochrome c [Chthoniobacteraceae bacterium]
MKEPEDLKQAASHHEASYVDYRETEDVTRVHAAIKRENRDPETGNVPLPLWFLAVCGIAVAGAFFYLGSYSGSFSGNVYNESAGSAAGGSDASGEAAGAAKELSPAELGQLVFAQSCASCHQASGAGVPGQYPSLVGATYVTGGSKRLLMILLNGLQGHLKTESGEYSGAMPAQGGTITDKKLANLLTYIRQAWGNKAGPVSPEEVAAARKEVQSHPDPFVQADIEAVPANADMGGGAAAKPAAPAK